MSRVTLKGFFGGVFKRLEVAEPNPQKGEAAMADIRVKLSNRTFFKIDPTLAEILVEALPGQVEYVNVKPAAPLPTEWTYQVAKLPTPTGLHAIRRVKGAQVEILPVHEAKDAKKLWPECPAEVIAQFAAIPARERVGGPTR